MSYLHLKDVGTPATGPASESRLYFPSGRVASVGASGANQIIGGSAPWNLVRNSGFWFAQRQVPGTATTPAGQASTGRRFICADGWGLGNFGGTTSYTRLDTDAAAVPNFVEPGLQSRFFGMLKQASSTTTVVFTQIIDAVETETVRGRYVRLTVKMKTRDDADSSAATFLGIPMPMHLSLLSWGGAVDAMGVTLWGGGTTGSGADLALATNWSYIKTARPSGLNCVAQNNGNSYLCNITQDWKIYSGTFIVPTTSSNIAVNFWTGSNPQGLGLCFGDCMLTDSEAFYDYTTLNMANEYLRVARFYQKSFNIDTGPVQAAGANTGEFHFPSVVGASTAFAGTEFQFPVRMYQAPATLTLYNPAAANAQIRNVTLGTDCTVSAITANGESGAWVNATSPASTAAGNNMAVHWTADGEL